MMPMGGGFPGVLRMLPPVAGDMVATEAPWHTGKVEVATDVAPPGPPGAEISAQKEDVPPVLPAAPLTADPLAPTVMEAPEKPEVMRPFAYAPDQPPPPIDPWPAAVAAAPPPAPSTSTTTLFVPGVGVYVPLAVNTCTLSRRPEETGSERICPFVAATMLPLVIVACPFATMTTARAIYPASTAGVVCVPVAAAMPAFACSETVPARVTACAAPLLFGPLKACCGLLAL